MRRRLFRYIANAIQVRANQDTRLGLLAADFAYWLWKHS